MSTNATAEATTPKNPVEWNVNRRLVMLMWDRKVTQTSLATRLGLTQSGLSKKLHGRTGWGLDELATAAEVLRTSVGYLFGEAGSGGDPADDVKSRPLD